MQNKVFRFNLDIKEKEFKTDFNLVQLDNTSMLIIKLFDEGNKLETTKEDKAEIAIDKNDNTFCVLPCNLYDNEVNCTLDSNALASPGWTNCEVRIINEGKVLTSARFKIYIRENIVNNEKIKSTTEYKALERLINEAESMQESLKKGESVLSDVNKLKETLTEIKESILNKSKEINNNLAVADEKINLIKTYISKSETAINNLANNQNKIDSLSNLLKELEKIKLTLDELNASVNKANTKKTELDTSIENANREKTELDSNVENAKTQNTNLKSTITEAETAESSLTTSTQKGISQQSNLEKTIADSVKKNKILSDTNTKSETLNTDLNVLSQDLTNKITEGSNLKSNLDTSVINASTAKSNLDTSVETATSTNTNLKATDTEAKKTETSIKDLMSQLGKTENEVKQIIASGDLSKYVTDPKLQEALKLYATKDDLSKIDVTGQLVDYAKKSDVKTRLSEMTSDSTHRTVTDTEKKTWNNKVDKVTGKGLSTNDYTDVAKTKVDNIPASPKYTDTVTTINGKTGAITKDDIVALGIPCQDTNTTYGLASQSNNGLMSAADKKRLDNIREQVALTEAQYNALSSTQQNDSKKIYFIKA
ncbi:MAG: hypothetical protein E6864_00165 [Peptoniphilus harei]|nr:hypothetical protein [Peptoniphilus harei]MDU1662897.1 hypothetical protein [Peptoniphilus harei]